MKKKELHHWPVLALSCIDGRFIKRTIDWVSKETGGVFDFRTEVGSSKAINDSSEDREIFFKLIETSKKLHDISELWIIDHVDCGAYGGSKEFENKDVEKQFHIGKMHEASKIIKEKYPWLIVKNIYVDWDSVSLI